MKPVFVTDLPRIYLPNSSISGRIWQEVNFSTKRWGFQFRPPSLKPILNHCCIAVIHIQPYTYTCRSKINNNDERTNFFRKIYLSQFIRNGCERVTKGLCLRGELETEQTATYWPSVPLSLAALLSRSAGLLIRGPRGSIALFWVLVLSTASYLQLDWLQTNWTCRWHRVI